MFKLIKKEKNNYQFEIKIDGKKWEEYVEKTYEQNKGKYAVQGFRKGKVPRKVIEQNYGESVFYDDAFEMLLNETYVEILDKNKEIDPISKPDIKIEKFEKDNIEVSMTIPSMPEIKLGEYKNLTIETAKGEVVEKEVNAEIEQIRNRSARFLTVERQAKLGDLATIDFVGRVDGKEFEGGKAEDYSLELGSHTFIDTFEDQIVGMNIGEKRVIKVKFPENYTPELKNKDAEFDVELTKIEEKELPELNDEFASNVSEFETFADFKADIKKHLGESLTEKLNKETENKLIEAIVKNTEIEIPEIMVEEQLDAFLQDLQMRLSYQGMKLEDYFKYTNSSLEDFKKEKRETAEESVKTRLVLQEIIKIEKLNATQKEIDAKLQEIASKYNKSVEDYKKSMGERELIYFENGIIMDKLIAFLKENNILI